MVILVSDQFGNVENQVIRVKMLASDKSIAVVGLGVTGLSSALSDTQGCAILRDGFPGNPPGLAELKASGSQMYVCMWADFIRTGLLMQMKSG